MRVRVQFSKNGEMKYIGHLDVMRYFQKAIRRAELPAAYSDGFSPHMIMSFAAPLGVGITSDSEYFDLDLTEPMPSAEMVKRLDQEMAPGIRVKRVCEIPEEKKAKGMTVVAAASYRIQCVNPEKIPKNIGEVLEEFLSQSRIEVVKKTKKSTKEIDIRPLIYEMRFEEGAFEMMLSQGSANNLNPKLLMNAFAAYAGIQFEPFALRIHRNEIYADIGTEEERRLVPLIELGTEI